MDLLTPLISNLSAEERNEFRLYLKRVSKSAVEPKLFDVLVSGKELTSREIAAKFYNPINMNAYHGLRKGILQQLYSYIVMKRGNAEAQSDGGIFGMISMGQFMLEKNAYQLAEYYLLKAEKAAIQNYQYATLETIYRLLVSNARNFEISLQEYIEKWKLNEENYGIYRKLIVQSAELHAKIEDARLNGTRVDAQQMIDTILENLNFSSSEANNPAFLHTVFQLARSAFASTKEFNKLEPFLIRLYKRLEENAAFGASDSDYQLSFLFMIAHTLYRNRKFKEAEEWNNRLGERMPKKGYRSSALYPKYISLKAAIASYTGRNELAIEIMEDALRGKYRIPLGKERFNIQLNLAVYYFNASEFRKANKVLLALGHSDVWLEQKLGKEWRFKKNMIELIVQYELGNFELSLQMVKKTQKNFESFLDTPSYQSAGLFLKFTALLITNPEIVNSVEFKDQVKQNKLGMNDMKADIQAVSFYAWLRSKVMKRPYAEVLMERIAQEE